MNVVDSEICLRDAFFTDVKPMLAEWRKGKGVEGDPLAAYRAGGHEAAAAKARGSRKQSGGGYA